MSVKVLRIALEQGPMEGDRPMVRLTMEYDGAEITAEYDAVTECWKLSEYFAELSARAKYLELLAKQVRREYGGVRAQLNKRRQFACKYRNTGRHAVGKGYG